MRTILCALSLCLVMAARAEAADTLVVSSWGGDFRDLIASTIARKFTADTGVPVTFVTGGTIDRLNKAKLAASKPESDVTFTTAQVGWLYANDGLFETLDMAKLPNAANLVPQARISPAHLGAWAYVYTIVYRPDMLPKGVTLTSWEDLWNPALKGKLSAPDFDPSHLIAVSAKLSGADPAHWEAGQARLLALKPSFRAFYTDDANSVQLMSSGEAPVQVMLSMNAYHLIAEGQELKVVIPKEGGVLGIDTMAITKGAAHQDLAYKFINTGFDPEVQAAIAERLKGSPTVANAVLSAKTAALPGVFTNARQWDTETIVIDPKLRAEKLAAWRRWFSENMMTK